MNEQINSIVGKRVNRGANRQPRHQGQSSGDKIGEAGLLSVTQIDWRNLMHICRISDLDLRDLGIELNIFSYRIQA